MDEPLSNLDAKLRVGMRASLAQLHARLGVTTVYVTHDQIEAMTLGQRVAVMRDGRIVQVDEPQRLYHEPREPLRRRVHRLAGDEPRRGDDRRRRGRLRGLRVPLDARPPPRRRRRPRRRSASGPRRSRTPRFAPPELPRIDVDVEVVEELGSDTHVFFRVDARASRAERARRRGRRRDAARRANATLFTARVDPRTHGRGRRAARRSRSIPRASTSSIPTTGDALRSPTQPTVAAG